MDNKITNQTRFEFIIKYGLPELKEAYQEVISSYERVKDVHFNMTPSALDQDTVDELWSIQKTMGKSWQEYIKALNEYHKYIKEIEKSSNKSVKLQYFIRTNS
jgi:hypothetical protein